MIGLSDQPNCIYDSQNNRKEFLFRNVLLFDETGHELQTIQTSRHDRVIAFIPGDSIVSFEPEYEEVWENPVGGAKCYQFDINGIHAFTVDGQDIYADETARTHFRTQIFPAKIDNARILGQFTRNYTQTVKRAADNKRRYAPGWVHSTCLLRGFPKGAAPHLAHDFAEQSVVCYTLCRRCPENTVAAGEGKGI